MLIATEGIGVYCLNMDNYQISSFLNADSEKGGSIRSNRISDLFVDEHQRIWVADFPDGVSMVDGLDLEEHGWYKHVSGDEQSLINDRVNALLKDSEGDIWFATDNGISCYFSRTGKWLPIYLVSNILLFVKYLRERFVRAIICMDCLSLARIR